MIVCASLISSYFLQLPILAAVENIEIETQQSGIKGLSILDIIAIKSEQNHYIKNGEKCLYYGSNTNYFPSFDGNDIFLPIDLLKKVIDFSVQYTSATETFTFTKNSDVLTIRLGEDALYINGEEKYIQTTSFKTKEQALFPVSVIAGAFNIPHVKRNNLIVLFMDKVTNEDLQKDENSEMIKDLVSVVDEAFDDILYKDHFEGKINWSFDDWGKDSRTMTEHGITDKYSHSGNQSLYINAVPSSFAGFYSQRFYLDNRTRAYKISFYVKASENISGNDVMVKVFKFDKNNSYVRQSTLNVKNCGDISQEWKRYEFIFTTAEIVEDKVSGWSDFDVTVNEKINNFYFVVGLMNKDSNSAGTLYFDDVTISATQISGSSAQAQFKSDRFASWYFLGDSVKYTFANPDEIKGYNSITGKVYDLDGNLVYQHTYSSDEIINKGFIYTPKKVGYYEISFTAEALDGIKYELSDGYSTHYNKRLYRIEIPKHSFAVVAKEQKSVDDTNEIFFLSDYCSNTYNLQAARLVGFSGVRIHTLNWGRTGAANGFQKDDGTFDWTMADMQIDNAKRFGFKNVIANVLATPKLYAPEEEQNKTGTNVAGLYPWNGVVPNDMKYVADAMSAFTERYENKINGIEFWNEPYYGSTAFWKSGVDNFRTMTEVAYDAVKRVDPNMTFISAGYFASAPGFFDELLSKGDYKNKFDMFSYHGRYSYFQGFQHVLKKYGLENIPVMDSEGYYYNELDSEKGIKDYDVNNMAYMMCMLMGIKNKVKYLAHFCMFDGKNNREYSLSKGNDYYGIFTSYPHFEPQPGAVIMNNLIQQVGKEFYYTGEYEFAGSQKVVSTMNDGEPMLFLWNSKNENFSLCEEIKSCFTDETEIIDFEGNVAEANNLKAQKVYFIKKISKDKISKLDKKNDVALSNDFLSPYYTCKKEMKEAIQDLDFSELICMDNAVSAPFDKKTFSTALAINWISSDWNWVGSGNNVKSEEFGAKHTAYINDQGLYVMVNVTDNNVVLPELDVNPDSFYNYDSLQIGIDTIGRNNNSDRIELQIALTSNGAIIFKGTAPDIYAMLPDGYTNAGKTIPAGNGRIERTESGLSYKVFIPMTELFPYVFPGSADYIRLSLLVNQNNGKGREGYLEWSSGIGASKDAKQYGVLKFNQNATNE